jgi:hypothetical protein
MADDTWTTRDLPVLDAAVTLVDAQPFVGTPLRELAEAAGVSTDGAIAALRALETAGLVEVQWGSARHARVTNVSGEARQLVGAWPTPESYADRLTQELDRRIDQTSDDDERGRLEKMRDAAIGMGRGLFVDVTAAVLTRQIPGAH